ncbi:CPBP family intramembrane glutamic endopeptidase [Pseudoalteromonas aurantia]|uniref:CAAX prenyl protease 2/Lysostaphin resistance protein A-like domain-containing protein n=1 Tax=Pseudoalteromonas aurantia 208 TaxID=1314867 RepID=A0ABR9E9T9_9GAMM|nr:CPBP family intramembrane glutamic endopeptidase [Pseudoalteromonas aurantia]MBE0367756.1 hypothetical protein [Pseudoalteromonas aurantia 208]
MKNIFYDDNKKVRNGWWIILFIGLIALTRPIYKPVKQVLSQIGFTEHMLEPVSLILLFFVTYICLRIRRQSLSDVGIRINLYWFKQFFIGTFAGIGMILITVLLIYAIDGVTFELNQERDINIVIYGLYLFLLGAFFEELLHRGFIFQRLIEGIGPIGAQLLIASLFAFGHAGNPGMEGTTEIFATLNLFLLSLIFGFAYIKTHSLALPIGLHLGWNWAQGNILGFGVSGHNTAGWLKPTFHGVDEWITGGNFGPEASIFSIAVCILSLIGLYHWKSKIKLANNIEPPKEESTSIVQK